MISSGLAIGNNRKKNQQQCRIRKDSCFNKIDAPIYVVFSNKVTICEEGNDFCRHFMLHCFLPHPNTMLYFIVMGNMLH